MQRDCLADALLQRDPFGIWGGLTAPERERALKHYVTIERVMASYDAGILEFIVRRV